MFPSLLLILLLTALCALSLVLVRRAAAEPGAPLATDPGLSVYLLIDHSNSMYDRGNGVGSDPDFLRIEAARLFISYLGVDAGPVHHQVGVINFGQQAHLLLPLTPLADAARRDEINRLLDEPPRLHWTDQNAALELAYEQLFDQGQDPPGQPAVVLLTDGKPEWSNQPSQEEISAYQAATRALAARYAERGTPLFIILLANPASGEDPEISQIWRPLWQEVAPGRFFEANDSADLLPIYHDIAVALSGDQTAGAVVDEALSAGQPSSHTVPVEPDLARVTLVIYTDRPETEIQVLRPDGSPLQPDDPGVVFGGSAAAARTGAGRGQQQIWAISEPVAGPWQVIFQGQGRVVVWKDMRPRPVTPTPTPTVPPTAAVPPVPTATPTPSPSPTTSPTATPQPVIGPVYVPAALLQGARECLVVRLGHASAEHRLSLRVEDPNGQVTVQRLLDDGRAGDPQRGDGLYSAPFEARTAGVHFFTWQLQQENRLIASWESRMVVEQAAAWEVLAPREGERGRVGRSLAVEGQWTVGGTPLGPDQIPADSQVTVQGEGPSAIPATSLSMHEGRFRAELSGLSQPGLYTLTVQATGTSPSGLPMKAVGTVRVALYRPLPGWAWLAGGLLAVGATAWAGWYLWRRRRPRLTGQLIQIGGPPLDTGSLNLDLDALSRESIRFGGPEGDWASHSSAPPFSLSVGESVGHTRRVQLQAQEMDPGLGLDLNNPKSIQEQSEVMVDGQPVRGVVDLRDGAVIEAGPFRLRYENLLLPQAEQQILGSHWSPDGLIG